MINFNDDFPKIKVLVIEADSIAAHMATTALEAKDCIVDWVSSGKAALEKINDCYQLILLDVRLPDIDGFKIAKIIKSEYSGNFIPIVIITDHEEGHQSALAKKLGMNGYFSKPITTEKCDLLLSKLVFGSWDKEYFYLFEATEIEA